MAASVPLMVMPAIVIVLLAATVLVAKDAVAPLWSSVTMSSVSTPNKPAVPFESSEVAFVVASYTRFAAVMPETEMPFAVIDAEVLGWVSV